MSDVSKQDLIDLENRIKQDLTSLEDRLTQHMERLETKLLTAFHGWARSMEMERVSELERRNLAN